jgi:hypothetical protein
LELILEPGFNLLDPFHNLNKFIATRVARRHTKMPAAQLIRGKLIARKFLFVPKNEMMKPQGQHKLTLQNDPNKSTPICTISSLHCLPHYQQ